MAEEYDTSVSSPDDDGAEAVEATSGVAETEPEAKTPRRKRRFLKWILLGLALLVLVGILLPGFSVTQPGYYRRYPDLANRMDHWTVSTHSKISCVECHIEPGVGNFVKFAAQSIPAFYSQLIQGPSTTNLLKAPSKSACNKCHTKYRAVAPSGDLLIPHKAHVEVLGMECRTCHKDLVHSSNRRGFNRPEMEGCLEECHDGDTASNKCVDCHTQKNAPASHKAKTWPQVHGTKAETEDCGKCHDWTPKYCEACHKQKPASHKGNWKKNHGPVAEERGDGCLVCHDEKKFCGECH